MTTEVSNEPITHQWLMQIGLDKQEEFRDLTAYGIHRGLRLLVEYMPEKYHLYVGEQFIKDGPSRDDVIRLLDFLKGV